MDMNFGSPAHARHSGQDHGQAHVRAFLSKHPEVSWSNRQVSEDVVLRLVLGSARFSLLLDASLEFGLDRVSKAWEDHKSEVGSNRIRERVSRILSNIHRGYEQAQA